jgi:tetratricopeptide (TPR) repeat protein
MDVKPFLSELLIDVPLARGAGDPERLLSALEQAALFYPVFPDWPSPVDEWLDEAEQLSRVLGRPGSWSVLQVRRAVVLMRRNELDPALDRLQALSTTDQPGEQWLRCYAAATRCRIYVRRHEFEPALAELELAERARPDRSDWVGSLPLVAMAELLLEQGDEEQASTRFAQVLGTLPVELVEERVQALQALGFLAIGRADVRDAVRYLDLARTLLTEAGVWSQVIQMDLVVGGLEVSLGETSAAELLFREALELCERHDSTLWVPLLQLGLARAQAAAGSWDDALGTASEATVLFARRGDVNAFMSMVTFLATVHLQAGDTQAAFRTLAFGAGIARRLRLPTAERVLRARINHLREELGAETFDSMVGEMVRTERNAEDGVSRGNSPP